MKMYVISDQNCLSNSSLSVTNGAHGAHFLEPWVCMAKPTQPYFMFYIYWSLIKIPLYCFGSKCFDYNICHLLWCSKFIGGGEGVCGKYFPGCLHVHKIPFLYFFWTATTWTNLSPWSILSSYCLLHLLLFTHFGGTQIYHHILTQLVGICKK